VARASFCNVSGDAPSDSAHGSRASSAFANSFDDDNVEPPPPEAQRAEVTGWRRVALHPSSRVLLVLGLCRLSLPEEEEAEEQSKQRAEKADNASANASKHSRAGSAGSRKRAPTAAAGRDEKSDVRIVFHEEDSNAFATPPRPDPAAPPAAAAATARSPRSQRQNEQKPLEPAEPATVQTPKAPQTPKRMRRASSASRPPRDEIKTSLSDLFVPPSADQHDGDAAAGSGDAGDGDGGEDSVDSTLNVLMPSQEFRVHRSCKPCNRNTYPAPCIATQLADADEVAPMAAAAQPSGDRLLAHYFVSDASAALTLEMSPNAVWLEWTASDEHAVASAARKQAAAAAAAARAADDTARRRNNRATDGELKMPHGAASESTAAAADGGFASRTPAAQARALQNSNTTPASSAPSDMLAMVDFSNQKTVYLSERHPWLDDRRK
jgi:hypothetical protein